jgi:hypothetical protein
MTRRATHAAHAQVTGVIELHAKTLQTWKRFQRCNFWICMTDGADRAFRVRELLRMTSGAGQVAGSSRHLRPRRVCLAPMAQQTRQPRMVLAAVLKFRVIQAGRNLHLLRRCLRFR